MMEMTGRKQTMALKRQQQHQQQQRRRRRRKMRKMMMMMMQGSWQRLPSSHHIDYHRVDDAAKPYCWHATLRLV
jgi:hypothetical protein